MWSILVCHFFLIQAIMWEMVSAENGKKLKLYWWDNAPYIYNKSGVMSGLIPDMFRYFTSESTFCGFKLDVEYYQEAMTYQNLTNLVINIEVNSLASNASNQTVIAYAPMYFSDLSNTLNNVKIAESKGLTLVYWNVINNKIYRLFIFGFKAAIPVFVITFISLFIFGIVMWLLEHKKNSEQFDDNFFKGGFNGYYWACVTVTTVGYGDLVPKTFLGKMMTLLWVNCSILLIPTFTALLTSGISGKSIDIKGEKVSAIHTSKAEQMLVGQRCTPVYTSNYKEAFENAKTGHTYAALADTNTVAAMQDKLWYDYSLDVGETFPVEQDVIMLLQNEDWKKYSKFWSCFSSTNKYMSIEQLKPSPVGDVFSAKFTKTLIIVLSTIAGALILLGISLEGWRIVNKAHRMGSRGQKEGVNIIDVKRISKTTEISLEDDRHWREKIQSNAILTELNSLEKAVQAQAEAISKLKSMISVKKMKGDY